MLLLLLSFLAFKNLDDRRLRSSGFLGAAFILLFFTHTLTFFAIGMGLFFLLLIQKENRPWKSFLLSGAIAFVPALAWIIYAKAWTVSVYEVVRYQYPGYSFGQIVTQPLHDGFIDRVSLFLHSLKNFNNLDFFPALFLLPIAWWIVRFIKNRQNSNDQRVKEGFALFALLVFIFIYTLCASFTSPQMIGASAAVETRYIVILLPPFMLLSAYVIGSLFRLNKVAALLVAVLFIYSNVLTLVPITKAIAKTKPVIDGRITSYMSEIRSPRFTSYEAGMELIDKYVKDDETVFIYPEYAMLTHQFYQGGRILVPSVVIPDNSPLRKAVEEKLPKYLTQPPEDADWILVYGPAVPGLRSLLKNNYVLKDKTDVFWYDTSRPEPEMHSFKQWSRYNRKRECIYLWERKTILKFD